MFAVIKTGGKQYKVASGDVFTVEKLAAATGDAIQFNDVLMIGGADENGGAPTVGAPLIEGAGVQAEVVAQTRGPKVITFKRRRRKHSSKSRRGHKQDLTLVKITEILATGADKSGVMAAIGAGSVSGAAVAAAAAPKKAPAKKAEPKAEAAPAAEAAKPGNLLDAPKGEADDLAKISGVGPKLVEKLNANGVYHFWQIAAWGPSDVAYMDDQLSFKGRIDRDDWISQATAFADEAK